MITMNKVYFPGGKTPITPVQMADAANAITRRNCFTPADFEGENSRIAGAGHCDCEGNGEFELLPKEHPIVADGKKRYMFCRACGCYSHL